ncbi:hypothetical protein FHS39_004263 [Streptomyces olivoverticillatus]|uniref:Uncharacterized protein n=1 Tax=Streptomyces olivoverticillatus TaxID=66427 RepID=A0A7W7LTA0_9ACTN|nr:DUF6059 family protein [Streptomyces olivoverticillatus]MBB4895196.1 hypothetical protein [Streptomyces olivoverticillatus]
MLRTMLRALGSALFQGFRALGALYFPMPPCPESYGGPPPCLSEPPPGSPERLLLGVPPTPAERGLFGQLGGDPPWPGR